MVQESEVRAVVEKELQQGSKDGWASFTGGASFSAGVDSLKAIDICLALEEAFGIIIAETDIPPGGFGNDEECVSHFVEKVMISIPTSQTASAE